MCFVCENCILAPLPFQQLNPIGSLDTTFCKHKVVLQRVDYLPDRQVMREPQCVMAREIQREHTGREEKRLRVVVISVREEDVFRI